MIGRATPRMPAAGYTTRTEALESADVSTTVTTTGANQTFKVQSLFIPGGASGVRFTWGDGTSTWNATSATHTYAEAGTYTFSMFGVLDAEAINLATNAMLAGDLDDFAALTKLRTLSLHSTGLTGNLSDLSPFTALKSVNLASTSVTGALSSVSSMTTLTSLSLSNLTSITGNLSDLTGLTGLTSLGLGGCTSVGGDLADVTTMTGLQSLQIQSTAVDSYSGGAFSSALRFFFAFGANLAATPLGSVVDTLHADRVNLGGNGCTIDLRSNPGSASVASSHSTKISELQAAGCTVTI